MGDYVKRLNEMDRLGLLKDEEWISVDELVPYENNPRDNDNAVPGVMKSIDDYSFLDPVIITGDNIVINGHTRLKAAKKLGLRKVRYIRASHLTEQEAKEVRLVDNKTAEVATWNFEKLDIELKPLELHGFDAKSFGFSLPDIDYAIANIPPEDHSRGGLEDVDELGDTFPQERPPHMVMCPHCREWHEI